MIAAAFLAETDDGVVWNGKHEKLSEPAYGWQEKKKSIVRIE